MPGEDDRSDADVHQEKDAARDVYAAGRDLSIIHNTEIRGGSLYGPVLQGPDFRDVDIGVTVRAAVRTPTALDQLPALRPEFTGRGAELAVLAGLLSPDGQTGAVVVAAVAGLAGVGKTTLAVQAGHAARREGWYPGGMVFIALHGYDDQPVQPVQALDSLLRALGIPAEHIPPGVEERAALYRSALAQVAKPMLVIADNASSEAQVRPLLPGVGPHRVLVTSRDTLAGLGARLVEVTALDNAAAAALLDTALRIARPADDRITGDPDAARLARACGGLPLALEIIASILNADPTLTVADLAGELAAESTRLARLTYDDGSGPAAPSVTAAFRLSSRRLKSTQARLFRLLPASPGPDISTAAAAALAGLPPAETRALLGGLARAHLVEPTTGTVVRWRMHDLVRLYAESLSGQYAEADGREQAIKRLIGHYQYMTAAADARLRALPGIPALGQFTGRKEALAWLDAERPALLAAITLAAATGRDQAAMHLPIRLAAYLEGRRRFDDWLAVMEAGRDAARRLGNRVGEATALTSLGVALTQVTRSKEAIAACQEAAAIFHETGDRDGEGTALIQLGRALRQEWRGNDPACVGRAAAAIFREIAATFRKAGDRYREGLALTDLGYALDMMRWFEEAMKVHKEAAAIFRETGDRYHEGLALHSLGLALAGDRRFDEAIAACREAAAIFHETGDPYRAGLALTDLGQALDVLWEFEEAVKVHKEAAAIFHETGDPYRENTSLYYLDNALAGVRRINEAIAAHQEATANPGKTGRSAPPGPSPREA